MARKNKRPWLLDKIADLIIVILGITIAFQLGKMQERDKKTDEVAYVYSELLSDLNTDAEELTELIESQSEKLTRVEELAKTTLGEELTSESFFELHQLLNSVGTFSINDITYKVITANGQLPLIKTNEERKRIIGYYEHDQLSGFYEDLEWKRVDALNSIVMKEYLFTGEELPKEVIQSVEFKNIILMSYFNLELKVKEYEDQLERNEALVKLLGEMISS